MTYKELIPYIQKHHSDIADDDIGMMIDKEKFIRIYSQDIYNDEEVDDKYRIRNADSKRWYKVSNLKVNSSRQIKSSQKGFENVAEGTQYDDYHIDTNGMGILSVGNIIWEIEGRGNQAVLTVQTSSGSTNHSQFSSEDWREYKDSVNRAGNIITDVWVTEVEGGSYGRNSRRPVKSAKTPLPMYNVYLSAWQEPDTLIEQLKQVKDKLSIKTIAKYPNNEILVQIEPTADVLGIKKELENMADVLLADYAYVTIKPEYVVSSLIRSARYIATDPETGEVLGSADTYEEAVNEWGEDVTITDSEAAEGQEDMEGGLFSSKKSNGYYVAMINGQYLEDNKYVTDELDEAKKCSNENEAYTLIDDFLDWNGKSSDDEDIEYSVDFIESSRKPIKSSLHTEVVENFPEYMVNYAVYGEHLDVTDEDISLYEEWRERNGYGTCFGTGSVYDESYFSSNPAFGLPCTVIPVVFEVSDSVTSSKKPETTKQFVTRILSELETGEITEDEAAEEIAEANDVNIGYARQILSNYIADKDRYITSGMLELGDALNVEFDPDGNLDSWSVDFATDPEKPAPTLGGELVRAARYIISAFRDNNEKVGWGYAREVLNPAARFIVENTDYKQNDVFEDLLDGQTYDDDAYRQFIDMFEIDFADYLRDHEELFHKLNKKSFEENVNDEDEYSSIDYFSVNNEHVDYWFRYEDGQYVCDNVDPVVNQEWNEGDIITAEDFPFDNIDFNEEYGTFDYDDGFIYSWEDGDGESVRISNVEYKYSEFEEGDVLTPDELENLAENGYKFHDTNGNEIRISDIM